MNLFKTKKKEIMLTPEIEGNLERMNDDLLLKTMLFYKDFNYELKIKKKAQEILKSRGISIESVQFGYSEITKINIFLYGLLLFFILLLIGVIIYLQYNPSLILSWITMLLLGLILLTSLIIKQSEK